MTITQAKQVRAALIEYENYSYWFEKLDELQLRCSTSRHSVVIEGFDYKLKLKPEHAAEIVELIKDLYERKMNNARKVIEEIR